MSDEAFFDTNIIAYSFDRSVPSKRRACKRLVKAVYDGELKGHLSNQILAELFVVLTSKVGNPLSPQKASAIVEGFAGSPAWKAADYRTATVRQAAADSATTKAPFWDLLIAETMREAGVKRIYTENVGDFARVPWVDAVDPMREGTSA